MNNITPKAKKSSIPLVHLSCYPWLVIFLCSTFLFYKYILQVSPSLMTTELMAFFHVSGAGLGNLAATYFYTYAIMQLFAGILLDKFSPRILISLAMLATALGALFFSTADNLLEADISRALIGAGAAFATVSYMKMAALWFHPSRFAFVSVLLATAAMLGALFGEAPMALLINLVGWQQALLYVSLMGVVLAVIFILTIKDKQEDVNVSPVSWAVKVNFKEILVVLKSLNNWYLMFYSGLAFAPVAVFGGLWGNPFLEVAYRLTKAQAASLTSLVFLGLAAGGPLFGLLSDRLKQRESMMAIGTTIALIALLLVLYVPGLSIWLLATYLFIFGFGIGAFMLVYVIGKEINLLALAATVIAMLNTGDALLGALSEPLTGWLLDLMDPNKALNGVHYFSAENYRIALVILPIYLLAALFFLWRFKKAKIQDYS